jgi:hypothetical protein
MVTARSNKRALFDDGDDSESGMLVLVRLEEPNDQLMKDAALMHDDHFTRLTSGKRNLLGKVCSKMFWKKSST